MFVDHDPMFSVEPVEYMFDSAGRRRPEHMSAIERMRDVVRLFNACSEEFASRFTEKQLVTLWLAYRACGWDITPDSWSEQQVKDALKGRAPDFDEKTEEPVASSIQFKVLR